MFKKISESSENDPEQLTHTSENSPALSLSQTDSGPVESESSRTGATNFKELVKVTVLIANVYLSTCGSLSSVQ
jgi:hypothetical protein